MSITSSAKTVHARPDGSFYAIDPAVQQHIQDTYTSTGKVIINIATVDQDVTVQVEYLDEAARLQWLNDPIVQSFLAARRAFYAA